MLLLVWLVLMPILPASAVRPLPEQSDNDRLSNWDKSTVVKTDDGQCRYDWHYDWLWAWRQRPVAIRKREMHSLAAHSLKSDDTHEPKQLMPSSARDVMAWCSVGDEAHRSATAAYLTAHHRSFSSISPI
eukprot:SAG31_NODE_10671_length_1111_cov_1.764822_2_plen_129_part_01